MYEGSGGDSSEIVTSPEITNIEKLSDYAKQRQDELNGYGLSVDELEQAAASTVNELDELAAGICLNQRVICRGLYRELDTDNFTLPPSQKEPTFGITEAIHSGYWFYIDTLHSIEDAERQDNGEELGEPTYARLEILNRLYQGTKVVKSMFFAGPLDVFMVAPVETSEIIMADKFYLDIAGNALSQLPKNDQFVAELDEILGNNMVDFRAIEISLIRALRKPAGYKYLDNYVSYLNGRSGLVGKFLTLNSSFALDPEEKPLGMLPTPYPIEGVIGGFCMSQGFRLNSMGNKLYPLKRQQLNIAVYTPGTILLPASVTEPFEYIMDGPVGDENKTESGV
jgi:hypothetical protein